MAAAVAELVQAAPLGAADERENERANAAPMREQMTANVAVLLGVSNGRRAVWQALVDRATRLAADGERVTHEWEPADGG